MYRVYFDNIEQAVEDIININSIIALTIIREDGITSTEQILREKTEMELQFTGCAYDYICGKIATDRCTEIQFSIEDTDTGISFNGVINTTMCELKIAQRIGKTKIKDDSFSAYIRDFLDVEVNLYASMSKGCQDLENIKKSFVLKSSPSNNVDVRNMFGFDVLDVMKFIVSYHTDNNVDVVSTYLTTNKYMITTGYNMTLSGTVYENIYPTVSLSGIFGELRNKFRLYMGIERYPNGVAYLRIEPEDYFFADTPLLTIPEVHINTVQSYDLDRNFSVIEVGSEITDLAIPESEIYYPQRRFTAWNDEKYLSCGTCLSTKGSTLSLVNSYIIDTNVIYEALAFVGTDYDYNDNIFLINYEVVSGTDTGKRDLINSVYVYNYDIRNEEVVANWIDYVGRCITLSSYPKNGFLTVNREYELTVPAELGGTTCTGDLMSFPTDLFDNEATLLNLVAGSAYVPTGICGGAWTNPSVNMTYFEVLTNASYNFRGSVIYLRSTNTDDTVIPVDFMISVVVYTDDTFTTIASKYDNTVTGVDICNDGVTLEVITGNIDLSVGNCVIVYMNWLINYDFYPFSMDFAADEVSFEMIADSNSCRQDGVENQNSKPFLVEFDYPLCAADYLLIKDNKSGYIEIAGNRYWIKELTYKQGLSQLKLMGNSSLC